MTNTNCLIDMKCPNCGNEDRFRIAAVIICPVTDEGSEATGDHHWDKDSFCHCPECELDGKVGDFSTPRDERSNTELAEPATPSSTKIFDNYEISPCTRFEVPGKPGHFYYEVCKPEEADAWTLYGPCTGEGAQAIGDFDSREHAEEVFQRIIGIPFAGARVATLSAACAVALAALLKAALSQTQPQSMEVV